MSKVYATVAEVKAEQSQNGSKTCLVVIGETVYDTLKFNDEHPGGADAISSLVGTNATEAFEAVGHSAAAKNAMAQYKVGTVKELAGYVEKTGKNSAAVTLSDEERERILREGRAEMNRITFKHDILPVIIAGFVGVSTYLVVAKLRK